MLQLIRDRSQGLVAGVIVFFICLTFALFGVQQYLDAASSVVVGEVNGEEIPLEDFQRSFQQLRQRAQAMLGDNFDPDEWSGDRAKLSTLEYLVDEELMLQLIDKANIRASDDQVLEYIQTSPQFQEEGEFSKDLYQQMVRAIGFSELGFEQQVRKDIVLNQLRAGIGASAFVTSAELRRIEQLRQQTRDIGFTIIGIEGFESVAELPREELDAWYAENIERYREPEKVALAYVELSIESLMSDVQSDDTQLRAYYEENKANYAAQEQRNANHILIQVPRTAEDEEVEAARKKAMNLRELAESGSSFEDLARESSDDVGSRTDGGETGFFGRGVMAPEFEDAVFAMNDGDISEPIRTDFGFHIIRLKETKPGGIKPFEEVQDDVRATFAREQAEALFFEQAEQLSEIAYEQPDSLEGASDALGITIKTTEKMTRGALAEFFSPAVVEAAFDPEVLIEGLNSEPIDVSNNRVIVVRMSEHELSRLPSVDDVMDEVVKDYRNEQARNAVKAYGEEVIARLEGGEALETLISTEELSWESIGAATRDSQKLNRAILRAAFRAETSDTGATFKGVPLGTGDYAVVQITNVTVPPIEQLNISEINQLRQDIATERTATNWRDFVSVVRTESDIETFPERL